MIENRSGGAIVDTHAWQSGRAPTREEVLIELGRELQMRRGVFPRWIEAKKLSQKQADERIDRLQAAHDYIVEALAEGVGMIIATGGTWKL